MTLFDIQSLFTNIPLDETIDICVETIYKNKKEIKGLLKQEFRKLLTFSVISSCFLFNIVYYEHVDVVSIGTNTSKHFLGTL